MRRIRAAGITALLSLAAAAPARADATAFIGANTTPANRQVPWRSRRHGPAGHRRSSSNTPTPPTTNRRRAVAQDRHGQRAAADAGGLFGLPAVFHGRRRHVSGEARHAPGHRLRLQHRRRREDARWSGPIRLRVDYRVFKLGSGALYSPAHRFYAGLNLKF